MDNLGLAQIIKVRNDNYKKQNDSYQKQKEDSTMVNLVKTATVNNQLIKVGLRQEIGKIHEISFTIDGSMDYQPRKDKVALTRALLAIWEEIEKEYGDKITIFCQPYDKDGYQNIRSAMFSKLGFAYCPGFDDGALVYDRRNKASFYKR